MTSRRAAGPQGIRVLVIWPPEIPVYFNAGHHLHLFTIGAYLRGVASISHVHCVDAGAMNMNWKEIGNLLASNVFDFAVIVNDFGSIEGIRPFIRYARNLSPATSLITVGRLSYQVPEFFRRYDLDAIAKSGDYEASVQAAIEFLAGLRADHPGVDVRREGTWSNGSPGTLLHPSEWVFPDIQEIPYVDYDRQYIDDSRKFCGIPERRELVVPVARGCPIKCSFCEVPVQQGARDRRRAVADVVSYIEKSFGCAPFEYVSFYAPTFTLNRRWVCELCEGLSACGSRFPWKCVTTLAHLDRALVALMADSGCVRISVGLETLDPQAKAGLPKIKRTTDQMFHEVADWCGESGVELNCFVILGMPGQSLEGTRYTIDTVRSRGARVRPTIYTPYEALRSDMAEDEVASFDRQFSPQGNAVSDDAVVLYRLAYGVEPSPTRVMSRIAQRRLAG
jgi:anaerobic magnesium-protoporphyrin IX monomethyl ester cyclase